MNKYSILVVEDEEAQRIPICGFLDKKGFQTFQAESCSSAVEILKNNNIDLVISDFQMKDSSGADVLTQSKAINPSVPVIIMTAFGTVDIAVDLMKNGAFDYIQKPLELDELLLIIDKARERQLLISENEFLKQQLESKISHDSIIYNSHEMEDVLNLASRVADSKASVLIRGESGTGKELIAKAIHMASDRKDQAFVVVNCAALPDTLFESELFGHVKGAFTGAHKDRIGKFEEANHGTLFIDEVGDIPPQIQVKLLRAVQFGTIEKLGSNTTIDLDVRIITATNRNLEEMIAQSLFREDLFYRFNVLTINIPPLRNRKSDIPLLIDHFIQKFAADNKKNVKSISREAVHTLMTFDFPGNIRQLENIIQRAVVLTRDEIISVKDLPREIIQSSKPQCNTFNDIQLDDLNLLVEELESSLIIKALDQSQGNQVKAAQALNISERTLRYKISKYNIK